MSRDKVLSVPTAFGGSRETVEKFPSWSSRSFGKATAAFLHPKALKVLFFLLALDVCFVAAHYIVSIAAFLEPGGTLGGPKAQDLFRITRDYSLSEFYEYGKLAATAAAALLCASRRGDAPLFLAIACAALILLGDNAMRGHERFGEWVELSAGLSATNGQMIGFALFGTAGLGLLLAGLWRASSVNAWLGQTFVAWFVLIGVFSAGVDRLHSAVPAAYPVLKEAFGVLEDGSELALMSVALWVLVSAATDREAANGTQPVPPE